MGQMKVLNQSGDSTVEWDPNDQDSVKAAHKEFKRLKKEGHEFFEVTEAKGKRIKRFDKKLGKIIAAPGVAARKDQKAAPHPRTPSPTPARQSGGPNMTPVNLIRGDDYVPGPFSLYD